MTVRHKREYTLKLLVNGESGSSQLIEIAWMTAENPERDWERRRAHVRTSNMYSIPR
jgi:hypothetical protein